MRNSASNWLPTVAGLRELLAAGDPSYILVH
jgi:hypothetical protein